MNSTYNTYSYNAGYGMPNYQQRPYNPVMQQIQQMPTNMQVPIQQTPADMPIQDIKFVNSAQAEVLAYYEQNGDMHIVLEYRGDSETAQKYLDAQNKVFGGN